jgi:hypothetical protein
MAGVMIRASARTCRTTTSASALGLANGPQDTKVGTFSQALPDEAKQRGWFVTSIRNDGSMLPIGQQLWLKELEPCGVSTGPSAGDLLLRESWTR